MDTAKRLKQLRTAKGLTTTELAKACNLSQAVISKLENNNRIADVPTLSIICDALSITLSEFFNTPKDLPPHLQELLDISQKLSPEQIKLLGELIKSFTK